MQRAVSSLLVIFFILWILPLGYFIKPSQQKTFCDGQRGMCMCTIFMVKKTPSHSPDQISIPSPSSNHESSSSGGAGNYYVSVKPTVILNSHSTSLFQDQFLPYKSPFLVSLEHVPKF